MEVQDIGRVKTYGIGLFLALGLCIGVLANLRPAYPGDTPAGVADLEVFVQEGCPLCAAAERFLLDLRQEWPALQVVVHDIGKDPAALARLQSLAAARGCRRWGSQPSLCAGNS